MEVGGRVGRFLRLLAEYVWMASRDACCASCLHSCLGLSCASCLHSCLGLSCASCLHSCLGLTNSRGSERRAARWSPSADVLRRSSLTQRGEPRDGAHRRMSDGRWSPWRVSHVASVLRPPLRAVCLIRCAVLVRVPCEIVETHRHTTAGSSVQARLSTLLGP